MNFKKDEQHPKVSYDHREFLNFADSLLFQRGLLLIHNHNRYTTKSGAVPPWDSILVEGDSDTTLDCGQDLTAQGIDVEKSASQFVFSAGGLVFLTVPSGSGMDSHFAVCE